MRIGALEWCLPRRVIGDVDGRPPLLIRWVLFRCPWFGVYLHKLCRSDYDRALHDHPWGFWSFVLWGSYDEVFDASRLEGFERTETTRRARWSLAYRPATWRHRVIISEGRPAWTLLLVEPRSRPWGFWVRQGAAAGSAIVSLVTWCHWRHFDTSRNICADDPVWPDRDGEGDQGAYRAMKGAARGDT